MLVPIQQDLSASHFHSLSRPPLLTFCTSCHKSSNESSNNKSKMTFIWQTHRHQSTKKATKEEFEGQSGVKRDFCRIIWYFSFSTPQRGGDDLERTPPPLLSTRAISRCSRKWRRGSKGCKSKPRQPNEKKSISLSISPSETLHFHLGAIVLWMAQARRGEKSISPQLLSYFSLCFLGGGRHARNSTCNYPRFFTQ